MHCPPTRQATIECIRRYGVVGVYGPDHPLDAETTIAQIFATTDVEWMRMAGCDHCDSDGKCLGHDATSPDLPRTGHLVPSAAHLLASIAATGPRTKAYL